MCGGSSGGPGVNATESAIANQANQQTQLQGEAFNTAYPVEAGTASGGLPYLNDLMNASSGATAQSFAPGKAQVARQLAQAGISPDDPRYIAAMSQYNEGEGQAFDQNAVSALQQNQTAKTGAAGNLLQFGNSQNPLQSLGLLLQAYQNF
jgi:hypothetical protein